MLWPSDLGHTSEQTSQAKLVLWAGHHFAICWVTASIFREVKLSSIFSRLKFSFVGRMYASLCIILLNLFSAPLKPFYLMVCLSKESWDGSCKFCSTTSVFEGDFSSFQISQAFILYLQLPCTASSLLRYSRGLSRFLFFPSMKCTTHVQGSNSCMATNYDWPELFPKPCSRWLSYFIVLNVIEQSLQWTAFNAQFDIVRYTGMVSSLILTPLEGMLQDSVKVRWFFSACKIRIKSI